MSGETDLIKLLANMQPVLARETYIFRSVSRSELERFSLADIEVMVREDEGYTLILSVPMAKQYKFDTRQRFCRITLQIHSSLEAVGLTAAVAERLTARNISANVVAGYYHDHIYVAEQDGQRAILALASSA